MIKTDNFNPVQDPKLLCTCEHPECDQRSVDQDTLDKLQLVRNWIKRAMVITSGGTWSVGARLRAVASVFVLATSVKLRVNNVYIYF